MKRLFWIIFLFILLPSALLSQTNLSLKSIADDLSTNYYVKTLVYNKTESDARYPSATNFYTKTAADALLLNKADTDSVYTKTANDILLALKADKTYVNGSDESIIASLYSYALKSYVNATDETIMLDDDSQDVQIEANRVAIGLKATQIDMDSAENVIQNILADDDSQDVTIEAVRVKSDSTETGLDAHIDNVSNPHQVTALQTSYTDTYSIAATTVQSAIDTVEAWLDNWITDSCVFGFEYPVTATLSYDASTQTFTITGNHVVYINGHKITKTTASKTHPATTGPHYFYYDSDGVLQTSTDAWGNDFFHVVQIAYVYYNADKVPTPQGLMFDEDHSHIMTTATHYYNHTTRGATSSDLFPIGDYLTAPAVPTNAGNQFSTAGGTLVDEDHRETINEVPDGGYYPIFWREGAAGNWTWQSGTYPVLVGTNYPKYNQLTGGSWTTTEISVGNYMNMYTAVTNANNDTYSVILIMGQNVYATLALAQAANPINTMSFGNLPFNEIILTNKITFRSNAGYGTIGKCRIESVESLAGITIRLGSAVVATSHQSLSGRSDAGAHPASAISYVDTYSMGVTDVQSAIDTIELWLAAIDVTDDSQDVAINSAEVAINSIIVGSGYATTAQVSQEVLVHNADANAHSTKFANYYTAAQTNATIEAAIAAIPAPSVNQTVTVTAGEALTAGQVVSLINESGSIKAYNMPLTVSTSPNGAESVFNAAATTYCSAVALDSTRFLVAYKDGVDGYPRAIVGTVSGSSVSYGNETVAFENAGAQYMSACSLGTDKVLVVYQDSSTGKSRMVVLTVSVAAITVGSPVTFDENYLSNSSVTKIDTDKALICYLESEISNTGLCKIITVSGTVPTPYPNKDTAGTTFNAAATSYISVSALSSTSAIVAYQDGGNSSYGTAQVLSISGTTITPGTEYVFESASTGYISTGTLSSSNCFIFYNDGADGKPKAIIAANSAGTISYGSIYEVTANSCVYHNAVVIDASHALVTYQDNSVGAHKNKIATITGTDISLSSEYTVQSATSAYISSCYLGSNKLAIAYQDAGNSSYGTAVVNTWATSSYASVSGISQGIYNSGATTCSVLISGVDANQSGLITGSPYYLASDFTIGTTPVSLTPTSLLNANITGEVKVGTAKSTTELIIGIDYK